MGYCELLTPWSYDSVNVLVVGEGKLGSDVWGCCASSMVSGFSGCAVGGGEGGEVRWGSDVWCIVNCLLHGLRIQWLCCWCGSGLKGGMFGLTHNLYLTYVDT